MCHVYKIVFPNSQVYIGITKNLSLRLNQHSRSKQFCGQLIRYFGISNVIYESIFEGSLDECLEIEECLVDAKWLKNCRCVNMATGGQAGAAFTGHLHTDESKAKIRDAMIGRVFTPEHRAKISQQTTARNMSRVMTKEHHQKMIAASKVAIANMTPEKRQSLYASRTGISCSQETKDKISAAHNKGGAHHNAKSVIMIDSAGNEIEFGSVKLASIFLGTRCDGITKALTGKSKTGYGYKWKYNDKI